MKAQMKFQKILSLATLLTAAIVFIYALCFFSGGRSELLVHYAGRYTDNGCTAADEFIDAGQSFVSALEIICIVFFCVIAVAYIVGCNKRRNYYITNYVAVGLVVAMSLFVAIYGFAMVGMLTNSFYNGIDWTKIDEFYTMYHTALPKVYTSPVSKSPAIFIIGFVVFFIVLVVCVAWVLNLIWKIKLMKGEKALLQNGLVKEVA